MRNGLQKHLQAARACLMKGLVPPMSELKDRSVPAPYATAFMVGQDSNGRWVALDAHHLCGGLFKSREDAMHFAACETNKRPGAVELTTTPLLLPF